MSLGSTSLKAASGSCASADILQSWWNAPLRAKPSPTGYHGRVRGERPRRLCGCEVTEVGASTPSRSSLLVRPSVVLHSGRSMAPLEIAHVERWENARAVWDDRPMLLGFASPTSAANWLAAGKGGLILECW